MLDWGPIVLSLMAAAVSILGLLFQRRKDNATVAETYEHMAERQAQRIDEMQKQIDQLKQDVYFRDQLIDLRDKKIEAWAAGIDLLIKQLIAKGETPIWKPVVEK